MSVTQVGDMSFPAPLTKDRHCVHSFMTHLYMAVADVEALCVVQFLLLCPQTQQNVFIAATEKSNI